MSADWAVGRTWFGNRYIEEIMDRKNELSFPHQEYLLYIMYNLNTWLHLTTSKSKIHVRGAIWNLVQTSSPSHFVRASGDVMSGEWWRDSRAEGCTLVKKKSWFRPRWREICDEKSRHRRAYFSIKRQDKCLNRVRQWGIIVISAHLAPLLKSVQLEWIKSCPQCM